MPSRDELNPLLRSEAEAMWKLLAVKNRDAFLRMTRGGSDFWEKYGVAIQAILRGRSDSELGVLAAQAKSGLRPQVEFGIREVLGAEWPEVFSDGRELLVNLAAAAIVAAMMQK